MPIAKRLSSPDGLSGQEARFGRPSARGFHTPRIDDAGRAKGPYVLSFGGLSRSTGVPGLLDRAPCTHRHRPAAARPRLSPAQCATHPTALRSPCAAIRRIHRQMNGCSTARGAARTRRSGSAGGVSTQRTLQGGPLRAGSRARLPALPGPSHRVFRPPGSKCSGTSARSAAPATAQSNRQSRSRGSARAPESSRGRIRRAACRAPALCV